MVRLTSRKPSTTLAIPSRDESPFQSILTRLPRRVTKRGSSTVCTNVRAIFFRLRDSRTTVLTIDHRSSFLFSSIDHPNSVKYRSFRNEGGARGVVGYHQKWNFTRTLAVKRLDHGTLSRPSSTQLSEQSGDPVVRHEHVERRGSVDADETSICGW